MWSSAGEADILLAEGRETRDCGFGTRHRSTTHDERVTTVGCGLVVLGFEWARHPRVEESNDHRRAQRNQRRRDRLVVLVDEDQTREHDDDPGRDEQRLDRWSRHRNAELLRRSTVPLDMDRLRVRCL